jgi:cytochrome c
MHRKLKLAFASCIVAGLSLCLWGQGKQFRIGRAPQPGELRRWDTTVLPDGTGLPDGSGTAKRGENVYRNECSGCHGDNGEGRQPLGPRLVGGAGTLRSTDPILTVGSFWPYATTVWEYTNRAMPYAKPGTLSYNDTYAVTAYLLYRNGITRRDEVINRDSLPRVKMPNREGFVPDTRPDVISASPKRKPT